MNSCTRCRHLARIAAVTFLVAIGSTAARAEEQPAAGNADELFRAGRDAMKSGDYPAACASFERSQAIEPAVGTTLNLALCLRKLERFEEARRELRRVLDDPGLDDRRRGIALRLSAELEQGERAVPPAPPVPPPELVTVSGPPELAAEAPTEAVPPPRPDAPTSVQPVAGYALGAAGLASLVTSAALGYASYRARQEVDARCDGRTCDDPAGLSAASRQQRLGNAATVALTIGVVATGAGAYLVFTAPVPRNATAAAPGFALGGRF